MDNNNNEDSVGVASWLEMLETEFEKASNDFDTVFAKLVKEKKKSGDMIEDGVLEYANELKEKVKLMRRA